MGARHPSGTETRSRDGLPSAFALIERFAIEASPALYLDFDGTLARIVARPEQAELAPGVRDALIAIAELIPLGILSGRDLDDLVARVGIDGIAYAGNHGVEIQEPSGKREVVGLSSTFFRQLGFAEAALMARVGHFASVRIEQKQFAVAVHTRGASVVDATEASRMVLEMAGEWEQLQLLVGKQVLELRPATRADKGTALAGLTERAAAQYTIYVGDDTTDEAAFAVANEGGSGVLVLDEQDTLMASMPTRARFALSDVDEGRRWLEELADRLRQSRSAGSAHTSLFCNVDAR